MPRNLPTTKSKGRTLISSLPAAAGKLITDTMDKVDGGMMDRMPDSFKRAHKKIKKTRGNSKP